MTNFVYLTLTSLVLSRLMGHKPNSHVPAQPVIHVVQDLSKASVPQPVYTAPRPMRGVPDKLDYISTSVRPYHPVAVIGSLPHEMQYTVVGSLEKNHVPRFDRVPAQMQKVRVITDGKE